jgi:hypothetical protein
MGGVLVRSHDLKHAAAEAVSINARFFASDENVPSLSGGGVRMENNPARHRHTLSSWAHTAMIVSRTWSLILLMFSPVTILENRHIPFARLAGHPVGIGCCQKVASQ